MYYNFYLERIEKNNFFTFFFLSKEETDKDSKKTTMN